jgi:peptidoglycan/LPS O-acetylase OafA/YrhL
MNGIATVDAAARPQRNAAIDLLRGGSMLYIVGFWHLLGYVDGIDGYKNAVTYRLTIAVLGLFTLMAGALAGRREVRGLADLLQYYRARAIRILPPYALAVVLFVPTGLLQWPDVPRGLLLLPAFDGEPLRTLWYVNVLLVYYALAPLLLLLRHRLHATGAGRGWALILVGACSLLALGLLVRLCPGLDPRFALYFPAFATGLLLAHPLLDPQRRAFSRLQRAILLVLAVAAVAFTLGVEGRDFETSLRSLPMATILPALAVLAGTRRWHGLNLPGWMQAVSYASYFMYLFHRPILRFVTDSAVGFSVPQPWPLLLILLLIGMPLVVAISWWGQRLYDQSLKASSRAANHSAASTPPPVR